MQRIFFFDIDNTLLDHATKAIPASALQALAGLKAKGHVVALATGRSQCHAQDCIDLIEPAYAITQNGARVLRGNAVIATSTLHEAGLTALFAWANEQGFAHGISDHLGGHVNVAHADVLEALGSVDVAYQADLAGRPLSEVFQAWVFMPAHLDHQLLPLLAQRYPQFDVVRWHDKAIDLLPKGINKMTGCTHVLADLGLSADRACAFGDGLNDLEMLQGVGTGIAMGNGHDQLKAVAQRIAEPIHLDGVAKMVGQLEREMAL